MFSTFFFITKLNYFKLW